MTHTNIVGNLNTGSTYNDDGDVLDGGILEVGPSDLEGDYMTIENFADIFPLSQEEKTRMIGEWYSIQEENDGVALDLILTEEEGKYSWDIATTF